MSKDVNDDSAAPVQQPAAQQTKRLPKTPRPRRTDAQLAVEILRLEEKRAQFAAALETKRAYYTPSDARLAEHIQRVVAAMAELTALVDEAKRHADAEREAEMDQWRAEQEAKYAREDQAAAQEFYERVVAAIAAEAATAAAQDEDN